MNAYELADEIEDNISDEMSIAETECLNKTVSMLRQQAKRIEELESHKELSDEEIEEIYYKNFNFEEADIVEFAKAIIKASRGEE
jgi:hypothetical protein